MSVDLSPAAVSARLRLVGEVTKLTGALRLHPKLAMSSEGISARLQTLGQLTSMCVRLARRPGLALVDTWLPAAHTELSQRCVERAVLRRQIAQGTIRSRGGISVAETKIGMLSSQVQTLAQGVVSRLAADARGLALAEARYAIALAAHGRRLGIAWTPDLCDWVDRLSECDGPVLLEGPTGWPFEAVAHQAFRMADECWTDVWVRGPCMDVALPVESLASLVRGQVGSRVVVPPRVVVSGFWETEAITQHAVVGPYRYPKDGRVLVIPAMPESGGEVWMQFKRCRYEFPLASTRWLLDPGAWSRGWIPPLGLSRDPTA